MERCIGIREDSYAGEGVLRHSNSPLFHYPRLCPHEPSVVGDCWRWCSGKDQSERPCCQRALKVRTGKGAVGWGSKTISPNQLPVHTTASAHHYHFESDVANQTVEVQVNRKTGERTFSILTYSEDMEDWKERPASRAEAESIVHIPAELYS